MLESYPGTYLDSQMSFNPHQQSAYSFREGNRSTLQWRSKSASILPRNSKLTINYKQLDGIQILYQHSPIKGYPSNRVESPEKMVDAITDRSSIKGYSSTRINQRSRLVNSKFDQGTLLLTEGTSKPLNSRSSIFKQRSKEESRPHSAIPSHRSRQGQTAKSFNPEPTLLTELSEFNDKLPSNRKLEIAKALRITMHTRPVLDEILAVGEKLPEGGRMESQNTERDFLGRLSSVPRRLADKFMSLSPFKSVQTNAKITQITPEKASIVEDNSLFPTEEGSREEPQISLSTHSEGRSRILSREVFGLEPIIFTKLFNSLQPSTKQVERKKIFAAKAK